MRERLKGLRINTGDSHYQSTNLETVITRSLFDQLSTTEANAVALLLGFEQSSPGFRNNLREMPAIEKEESLTIGDVTRAYLAFLTENLSKSALG